MALPSDRASGGRVDRRHPGLKDVVITTVFPHVVLPLRRHLKAPIRPATFPGRTGGAGAKMSPSGPPFPRPFRLLRRSVGQATRLRRRSCYGSDPTPAAHRTATCGSRLGKGRINRQHPSALACWQQVGHAKESNRSNPGSWRNGGSSYQAQTSPPRLSSAALPWVRWWALSSFSWLGRRVSILRDAVLPTSNGTDLGGAQDEQDRRCQ
jgi:hypothetical protein